MLCVIAAGAVAGAVALVGVAPAFAETAPSETTPWWHIASSARPANLHLGGEGKLVVLATDAGDAAANGESAPITISDTLPPGLTVKEECVNVGAGNGSYKDGGCTESEAGGEYALSPNVEFQTPGVGSINLGPNGPLGSFGFCETTTMTVTCTLPHLPDFPHPYGTVQPYEAVEVVIPVDVAANAKLGREAENKVTVSGGEAYVCNEVAAKTGKFTDSLCRVESSSSEGNYEMQLGGETVPSASVARPVAISEEAVKFGVENYQLLPENANGTPDTQAGSHPFQLTTTLALNQTADPEKPPAAVKDLHFNLPPGLIGNPTVFPQCTQLQFGKRGPGGVNECPPDTAMGVASVTFDQQGPVDTGPVPLFNLVPERGEPARFGFNVGGGVPVLLNTSVRTGGGYGVTVSVDNISELDAFISSRVTFWGVPGDPRHDQSRGWGCIQGGDYQADVPSCAALEQSQAEPFLTLPTSCTGLLQTSVEAGSWTQPGSFLSFDPNEAEEALDGCGGMPFVPQIKVSPDGQQASSPSGLTVDVHVPQEGQLNPTGLAQSNIKDITVKLPAGVAINPSSGDGLQACSSDASALTAGVLGSAGDQVGYEGERELDPVTEPGVRTPAFTRYLPGSFDALGAGYTELLQPGADFCPNASKVGEVTDPFPAAARKPAGQGFRVPRFSGIQPVRQRAGDLSRRGRSGIRVPREAPGRAAALPGGGRSHRGNELRSGGAARLDVRRQPTAAVRRRRTALLRRGTRAAGDTFALRNVYDRSVVHAVVGQPVGKVEVEL